MRSPNIEHAPIVPPTPDEIEALRTGAPDWFKIGVTLGGVVGLRQGEAAGLSLDRVDFLRRTLRVDRQLVTLPNEPPRFGPPKSRRSYRSVPLSNTALEALARHIEVYGVGDHDLLLHDDGRPLSRHRLEYVC